VSRRHFSEVGAALDFGLQVLTLLLGIHEDVSRSGLGHIRSPESAQ
jgi:hypothetical protein